MFARRMVLVAVVSGLMFAVLGSGKGLEAKGPVLESRVEGILQGINVASATLVIRTANGSLPVVTVTAATKIERNGKRVPLSAFKVGDRVQARSTAGVTTKVEAVGP